MPSCRVLPRDMPRDGQCDTVAADQKEQCAVVQRSGVGVRDPQHLEMIGLGDVLVPRDRIPMGVRTKDGEQHR
jgi:hypothetical protein